MMGCLFLILDILLLVIPVAVMGIWIIFVRQGSARLAKGQCPLCHQSVCDPVEPPPSSQK